MARILFFVFLAFLVWLAVRVAGSKRTRGDGPAPRGESSGPGPSHQPTPEPFEQCAWCGAHVPLAGALSLPDGRVYCSAAHRDQARLAMTPSTAQDR